MANKSNTNTNSNDLKKSISAFNTDIEYSIYLQNHLSYQSVEVTMFFSSVLRKELKNSISKIKLS